MNAGLNNRVHSIVEGEEISGVITMRTPTDMGVKIDGHFGFATGLHIAYFAQSSRSYIGPLGDETAKYLLTVLHRLAVFLLANFDAIRQHWAEQKPVLVRLCAEAAASSEEFHRVRTELRRQLRTGEVDQRTCQQKLATIRERGKSFRLTKWDLEDAFFEEAFPFGVSNPLRMQVVRVLEAGVLDTDGEGRADGDTSDLPDIDLSDENERIDPQSCPHCKRAGHTYVAATNYILNTRIYSCARCRQPFTRTIG